MTPLTRRSLLGALAALPVARPAWATFRVATNRQGIAMQGYDTRAYWTIAAARPGLPLHEVMWRNKPWHFATAEDAAAFAANPPAFEPQFGGYCTRAMSLEQIVDGDPEVWRIHESALYLFARPKGRAHFDKGAAEMIARARTYWDSLS